MCARRSRHCRNSTATTPCSGPGSPPARRAGFRCAKTQARSPKTRRAFCRTPSSDSSLTALPVATCVLLLCKAPAGPTKRAPAIPPVLKIVALVVFAQTLFTRAVDPVVPMIADDLAIEVKTAALLSSAYTFPYALVQPALGVTGDFFGKTRLMNLCLLVVALSALVCAVAEFLAARRHAVRSGAGGRLDISRSDGSHRRSRTGQSAPSGDRPAPCSGPHRKPRRLLDRGRDWRPARLARRVRNSRRVRIDRDDRGVLRLPWRGDAAAGAF